MGKENSWETLNFLYQYTNKKINKDGFFSWLHRKPWPDHFLFTLPCSFPRIGLNFSLLQIPHYFYSFLGSSSSSSSFFPVRILSLHQFTSAQFSHLVVSDFVIPWSAACQASLFINNSWSLLKLMFIKSVMPSNPLILCHPFLLLPSIFPSNRFFSKESVLHIRSPKYWNFSVSPSDEPSGLISFIMDWFDLLAVQGTIKSLLQYHNSIASVLQCSAFFMVQLSHPYMTTGKPAFQYAV